eukprot:1309479-Karenia_brevis.AAC.1
MLLYLAPARVNGTCFKTTERPAKYKQKHVGLTSPKFVTSHDVSTDAEGENIHVEIDLPSLHDHQVLAAQDPPASTHHCHVMTRVVAPAL